MKNFLYIILLLTSLRGIAQEFGDKNYYLVDSLVLEELSESDKQTLRDIEDNQTMIDDPAQWEQDIINQHILGEAANENTQARDVKQTL